MLLEFIFLEFKC